MPITLERVIHPVGQGAFYSERFYEEGNEKPIANIVYDCGTISEKQRINHDIKDYFSGEDIDILFLSHLHADHINGVNQLKSVCNSIKNVILPFYGDDKYILLYYYKFLEKIPYYVNKLIDNPEEYFGEKTRVFRISTQFSEGNNNEGNPVAYDIANLSQSEPLSSGIRITTSKLSPYWIYLPINLQYDKYSTQLRSLLSEIDGITDIKLLINDDKDLSEENLKKIKKWFNNKGVPLELNSNSLLMYSGPTELDKEKDVDINTCRLKGCLYTGDSQFAQSKTSQDVLKKILGRLSKNIGLIQIPHHGSKENFSKDIFKISNKCENYFLSHGIKNRYGHPSIGVTCQFPYRNNLYRWHSYQVKKCNLFCVNEDPQSTLVFVIEL